MERNEKRYLFLIERIAEDLLSSSRESTSAQEQPDNHYREYDFIYRLQIAFDKTPKNFTKRYSFGTNSQNCDVLLESKSAHRISKLHFCIIFDNTIDYKKYLILRDFSINRTVVSYSGEAKEKLRRYFIWILDVGKKERK